MPRITTPLTATEIKNLKPKEKIYFVSDGDNLLLEIKPSGRKTFIYEYKSPQTLKRRRITLGVYPTLTLAQARDKRNELKAQVFNGADVLEGGGFKNFGDIFAEWIESKEGKITPKQTFWIRRRFETLFLPKFEKTDIKNITRKDIVAALKPLLLDEKLETAHKTLGALNSFYKYALLHEYADHNIIADIDQRTLLGKREVRHYAFLRTDDEIKGLLIAIKGYFGDERLKACALFQLYTATRGENARNAKWEDIDLNAQVWKLSAEQMKNGVAHEVFLSDSVVRFLRNFNKNGAKTGLLFPSLKTVTRPISDNSVRSMLRNLGYSNDDLTPHGFRATFSTIAHERREEHGQSSDIIELCLAHVEKNKVKDAYNHAKNLKARATLMQWWSDYLDALGGLA